MSDNCFSAVGTLKGLSLFVLCVCAFEVNKLLELKAEAVCVSFQRLSNFCLKMQIKVSISMRATSYVM